MSLESLLKEYESGSLSLDSVVSLLIDDQDDQAVYNTFDRLKDIFSEVLKLSKEKIDWSLPMIEYGLDSIIITDLMKKINEAFHLDESLTSLLEVQTLEELSENVDSKLRVLPRHIAEKPSDDGGLSLPISNVKKTDSDQLYESIPSIAGAKSESLYDILKSEWSETLSMLEAKHATSIQKEEKTVCSTLNGLLISFQDGAEIEFFVGGEGAPLLLLGGLFANQEIWHSYIEHLLPNYQVIIYLPPGHGRSKHANKPLKWVEIIECFQRALHMLKIRDGLSIVGHSFGSSLALQFAIKYPDQIDSMILISPTAERPKGSLLKTIKKEMHAGLDTSGIFSKFDQVLIDDYSKLFEDYDLTGSLTTIKAKTTVIAGKEDDYVLPMLSNKVAKAIPKAEYIEIEEAGHLSIMQQPQMIKKLFEMLLLVCINWCGVSIYKYLFSTQTYTMEYYHRILIY